MMYFQLIFYFCHFVFKLPFCFIKVCLFHPGFCVTHKRASNVSKNLPLFFSIQLEKYRHKHPKILTWTLELESKVILIKMLIDLIVDPCICSLCWHFNNQKVFVWCLFVCFLLMNSQKNQWGWGPNAYFLQSVSSSWGSSSPSQPPGQPRLRVWDCLTVFKALYVSLVLDSWFLQYCISWYMTSRPILFYSHSCSNFHVYVCQGEREPVTLKNILKWKDMSEPKSSKGSAPFQLRVATAVVTQLFDSILWAPTLFF